jgi:Lantibiotic biosynthesis dehydratase C-term
MDTSRLETGVLSILTGARLETVAAEVGVPIITLSHAAKTYQAAGQAALDYAVRSSPWRHVSVIIDGRQEAEQIGITYLAPALEELRTDGAITGWWYMRKAGHWRIRYLPNPERGETATRMLTHFLVSRAANSAS